MTQHDDLFDELRRTWKDQTVPSWQDDDDLPMDSVLARLLPKLRRVWSDTVVPPPPRLKARPADGRRWNPAALAAAGILVALSVWGFRGIAGSSFDVAGPNEVVSIKTRTRIRTEGGLEMTRGRVRLILLEPSPLPKRPNSKE